LDHSCPPELRTQKLRTPYYENFNVNVENQLTPYAALNVAYVGSVGRKLFRFRDINQADPATGLRPFPNFTYINQLETTASSSYNSLQTSLRLNLLKRLNGTFNYTWSHSIDDSSDLQTLLLPQDVRNFRADRADSPSAASPIIGSARSGAITWTSVVVTTSSAKAGRAVARLRVGGKYWPLTCTLPPAVTSGWVVAIEGRVNDGTLGAAVIGHQCAQCRSSQLADDPRRNGFRIGKLGDDARVDKAGDFDLRHAGPCNPVDEVDFLLRRRLTQARFVEQRLESVARKDFGDAYGALRGCRIVGCHTSS